MVLGTERSRLTEELGERVGSIAPTPGRAAQGVDERDTKISPSYQKWGSARGPGELPEASVRVMPHLPPTPPCGLSPPLGSSSLGSAEQPGSTLPWPSHSITPHPAGFSSCYAPKNILSHSLLPVPSHRPDSLSPPHS